MRRTTLYVIGVLALFGLTFHTASADPAPQHYQVGTSCDDAWQEGPFPGTTSGINPSSDYKWTFAPVGWSGNGYLFNPGFRFENVQLAPGQTVNSATLSLRFANDFTFITQLDVPVEVELGNAQDICYTNDIIHRTFTDSVDWNATVNPNGYTTFDITSLIQQAVNSPSWVKGGSILVRLVGEDGRAEYPHSYGWDAVTWDCHCGTPPALDIFG